MGNKHSSVQINGPNNVTTKSFSLQPDPGLAGTQGRLVKQGSPTGTFPGYKHLLEPPPDPHPKAVSETLKRRQRSQSSGNGSVIADDAVFGGVDTILDRKQPSTNENRMNTGQNAEQTARSKTTDSGYFTCIDSDPKMRAKLRGSRLSLNESFFVEHGPQPGPRMPAVASPQRMFLPPSRYPSIPFAYRGPPPFRPPYQGPPMGPIPMFQNGPFLPPMFSPGMPPGFPPQMPPNADFDKKGSTSGSTKWLRKYKKKSGRREAVKSEFIPDAFMMPMPPPPMAAGGGFIGRAQSIDCLATGGLLQPVAPAPPRPVGKMFSSQMDLSHPPFIQTAPLCRPLPAPSSGTLPKHGAVSTLTNQKQIKGAKQVKDSPVVRNQAQLREPSNDSEKSSRRCREATHFEEEIEVASESMTSLYKKKLDLKANICRQETAKTADNTDEPESSTVVAEAQISVAAAASSEKIDKDTESFAKYLPETKDLPLKISPEAEAVLARNDFLFGPKITKTAPAVTKQSLNENADLKLSDETEIKKLEKKQIASPENVVGIDESEIKALLNPVLHRKEQELPKEFDPLVAWKSLDVLEGIDKRFLSQKQVSPVSICDEKISVRLVPIPPSRSELQGEPIYLEYDEKLPEFKKRLIETGSFDIPEKAQYSNDHSKKSDSGIHDNRPAETCSHSREWSVEQTPNVEMATNGEASSVNLKKPVDGKGSLRKFKDSLSHMMFHRSNSAERILDENSKNTEFRKPIDKDISGLQSNMSKCAPPIAHQERGFYNYNGFYNSYGSLTPSTANIKAGDNSEIDFSWVKDMESKLRKEKLENYPRQPHGMDQTRRRMEAYYERMPETMSDCRFEDRGRVNMFAHQQVLQENTLPHQFRPRHAVNEQHDSQNHSADRFGQLSYENDSTYSSIKKRDNPIAVNQKFSPNREGPNGIQVTRNFNMSVQRPESNGSFYPSTSVSSMGDEKRLENSYHSPVSYQEHAYYPSAENSYMQQHSVANPYTAENAAFMTQNGCPHPLTHASNGLNVDVNGDIVHVNGPENWNREAKQTHYNVRSAWRNSWAQAPPGVPGQPDPMDPMVYGLPSSRTGEVRQPQQMVQPITDPAALQRGRVYDATEYYRQHFMRERNPNPNGPHTQRAPRDALGVPQNNAMYPGPYGTGQTQANGKGYGIQQRYGMPINGYESQNLVPSFIGEPHYQQMYNGKGNQIGSQSLSTRP